MAAAAETTTTVKDLEKKAKEAFIDDDFSLAVDLYTEAINLDPINANLFADRAQAHLKLNAFTEAVSDANKAIQLDPSLPKAYLRKGYSSFMYSFVVVFCNPWIDVCDTVFYRTACIKLEEYHTAKVALEKGASFAPDDSRFTNLIQQCDRYIAGVCA